MNEGMKESFEEKLDEFNMKEQLQLDLKVNSLHRDALKMIRSFVEAKNEANSSNMAWNEIESEVVAKYGEWLQTELARYQTTLAEDEQRLSDVQKNKHLYHWMYQFVLIYRIGQKEII